MLLSELEQDRVDSIIEDCFQLTNFADASHLWLRKELVKTLLKVNPEERPKGADVLKLKMFLECDNADVLIYLIDRNAPLQVFSDLLLEDHSNSISSSYHDHDHGHDHENDDMTNTRNYSYKRKNFKQSLSLAHNMVLSSSFHLFVMLYKNRLVRKL